MITKFIGDSAEEYVSKQYRKKGFKILVRNFKTRFGELDIVAGKANLVVIVEVKSRSDTSIVPIEYSITSTKQQKIKSAALDYLAKQNLLESVIRFDAALITHKEGKTIRCEIIENAF